MKIVLTDKEIPAFSYCLPGSHRFSLQFKMKGPTFEEMRDKSRNSGGMGNDRNFNGGVRTVEAGFVHFDRRDKGWF